MGFKRRQFLILSSLSGLGLACLGKAFKSQTAKSVDLNNVISQSPLQPANKPILRFISVADTGTGTPSQYSVAEAMARYHSQNPFPIALMAGDNIYNEGEIEKIAGVFERPYLPLLKKGVKFYACLGNHDIRTDNGRPQVKYPKFHMKGRYYTFRRGIVQFFALDTNDIANSKTQQTWLEQELSRSDAPWKVVFGHHNIYSSGVYGLNDLFVSKITPLFKKYRVQLYINGHEHHYERTRPINGTTYLTCGGGAKLRPVGSSEWTEHSASKLSFAALDVYSDRMIIKGIGTDHQVFDQGVIQL